MRSVSQLVVLLWHALQSSAAPPVNCASGIWLAGFANAPFGPADKYAPLWQDLQAPAVTTLWFIVTDREKRTCDRWQESHLASPTGTGMWVAGFETALVLPLWQLSQVPVPTALAAECVYCTLAQLLVDLWQLSQFPVTVE
jgi:hypothetical protein